MGEKISHHSTKLTTERSKNTLKLKDEIITDELKLLHEKLVVVPIDKASSNDVFVCQKHYVQVLISKLRINLVLIMSVT